MSAGVSLLRCVYLPFWGVYLCRLGPVGRCGLWLPAVIGFSLHPIGLSESAVPRWNPQTALHFENGSALKKSNEGEYVHINTCTICTNILNNLCIGIETCARVVCVKEYVHKCAFV